MGKTALACKVLRDLGLSHQDVCGLLTYSTNRNPHESDLAAANAYACLTELQHYGCWSAYPGDRACGLPDYDRPTPPFGDAYLVHLGTDLSEERFDAAQGPGAPEFGRFVPGQRPAFVEPLSHQT